MKPASPRKPEPPVGLRESNKRAKAERLRRAALALFREKGFEATTTREVAERAGVGTGTLFLYVKTKDELVDFVFRGEIAEVVAARAASLGRRREAVLDALAHYFGGLLAFYGRDLALSRALLRRAMFATEDADRALTAGFLAALAELFAGAFARGELTGDVAPAALAGHAFTLYLGAVLALVNGYVPDARAAARRLRAALEVHLLGLRPRKAIAP